MSSLFEQAYNPDVLSCIANLSNDEVFTPPEIANQVLDMLPHDLWSNPDAKFLDPACKSGVFLREIAKRLIDGLEPVYPDLQERLDHIYKTQLYGIAITELTSLLSRRTLYCSKYPTSRYSVVRFDAPEGNIRYKNINHSWKGGRCEYCGASQKEYERDEALNQYAYEFIHLDDPNEVFDMKFDVIVGNPPYQLSDGGAQASAMPVYQKFIEQAKKLNPRFITMIVPSRWFSGGRGLDEFRKEMLTDNRLREIHDYADASVCFPGVEIKGGVCYFLWDRDHPGDCHVVTQTKGGAVIDSVRPLLEDGMDTFIRNANLVSIFKKVRALGEESFADIVSANDPYGFDVREANSYKRIRPKYSLKPSPGSVKLYYNGWRKAGVGYIDRSQVRKGQELIDAVKLFVPRVWGSGTVETDWVNPFLVGSGTCSTETYLTIGPFESEGEANNALSYIHTKFFHVMVSLIKNTQQAMQRVYQHVPLQDFSRPWTDEQLYVKYGLTAEEIDFIESTVDARGDSNGD